MRSDVQFRFLYTTAIVLALAACDSASQSLLLSKVDGSPIDSSAAITDANGSSISDAHSTFDAGAMSRDAAPDSSPAPTDAGGQTSSDAGVPRVVSCYTEGFPDTTCTLPTHCCFSNYSSAHDGECTTLQCVWGTIECDGPEDCPNGQRCCAHAIVDPDQGNLGYRIACQASACGAAPANQELCHPTSSAAGTCSSASACVTTVNNDNDLPSTLYICR